MSSHDFVLDIQSVKKKYCRSLRASIKYGIADIFKEYLSGELNSNTLREHEFWSVNDISFQVKKGECIGIIGANGAGKSTLLKLATGIFPPDSGVIASTDKICSLLEIRSGFHPKLSGRENTYLKGVILGMNRGEIDQKIDSIIDFSGLGSAIDMPMSSYSSGMYARLGFAIAAHVETDLLILDEVFAVGDLNFKLKCFDYINSIIGKVAILMVSHDMRNIARMCEKVIWMDKGQMKAYGDTNDVIKAYRNFMGSQSLESINHPGSNAYVSSVSVNNVVEQSKDLKIEIDVDIVSSIDFYLNLSITRSDGLHCFGIISDMISAEKTGPRRICLELHKLCLMPSEYYISLDILNENKVGFHSRHINVGLFKVTGNEQTAGVFRPEHQWRISDGTNVQ